MRVLCQPSIVIRAIHTTQLRKARFVDGPTQDYRVHIKHTDGHFEYVPFFSLPANDLNDVIAPSCYSCFDYPNALADLVSSHLQMNRCLHYFYSVN